MQESIENFRGGTWKRYKLGQAQFTRWLKQTAEQLMPAATAAGNGEKPSSNSFKKAQKKAAKAGIDNDVLVHWRELEDMASVVVEHAQQDIPTAPINILRDVIAMRKKSARFFSRATSSSENGDEDMQQKNAKHEHIIKVLERVLAKFEAVIVKVPGVSDNSRSTERGSRIRLNLNDLNNMFDYLQLHTPPDAPDEEIESDAENQPTGSPLAKMGAASRSKNGGKKKSQRSAKQKKPRSDVQSMERNTEGSDSSWIDSFNLGWEDEDGDDLDYYIMIYCFFEDFNLIRSYICERWCDYFYDRSVHLNTLAIITNSAFELFNSMEYNLIMEMRRIGIRDRRLGSYEFMMMAIFAEFGMKHIDYDAYDELSKEESDERIWKDEWEWLASPAFSTIRAILSRIPPGKTPMMRKSDRKKPVYGGLKAEELNSFKDAVINDLVFDVVCIKALKKHGQTSAFLPAESELLLSFQEALRNYDCSSAFIFSLQLYIDIRYILEDTVTHSFEQLQQTAHRFDASLPLQFELAAGPRFDLRRPLRQRQKELQRFMLQDVVLEDKLPRYLSAGLEREDVEDFSLLKHEPVWAGLLDFRAKLVMNELGHEFVHRSFLVEAAAYLYTAARAASVQSSEYQDFPAWNDMDKFLASYVDHSDFKRNILKHQDDPVAIVKSFGDIMPAIPMQPKPENIALDSVEDQTEEFRQSVRIRQILSQRYANDDRTNHHCSLIQHRLEREMESIESQEASTVLQDIKGTKHRALPNAQTLLLETKVALAEQRSVPKQQRREANMQRKTMLAQLSPIQQIQTLEDVVTTQLEGLLSIDFVALWQASYLILSLVSLNLEEKFNGTLDSQLGVVDSKAHDSLVKVVGLLGECLTGDPVKDRDIMLDLVHNVKSVIHKSETNRLYGRADIGSTDEAK